MEKVLPGQGQSRLLFDFPHHAFQESFISLAVPAEETDLPWSHDAGNIIALLEQETALGVDQYCKADIAVPRSHGTSPSTRPLNQFVIRFAALGQQVKQVSIMQARNQKQ